MPISSGKYRYRVAIQKYNATTDVWDAYGNAWAKVTGTGSDMFNDEEMTKATRSYEVRTRYNPSLTLETTGMRIAWTVQGATRYLYIHGVDADEATFNEESIIDCTETVR
jgi:head-tail adaptor